MSRRDERQSRLRRRRAARRGRKKALGVGALILLVAAVSSYCSGPQRAADLPAERQAPAYASLAADPPAGQPQARLRPANHDVDWVERHGAIARTSTSDCTSCHQEEDCQSCHTESLAQPFAVHPPNYEIIHATDARLDQANCTDCHKPETFCASCHIRTRVSAVEPNDPPTRLQFHPEGWLDASNPRNHAVRARQNITDCASCHQEQDCVTCHAGINPHPPDFQLNCGRWLRADPRPCAKCHGDVGRLKGLCF